MKYQTLEKLKKEYLNSLQNLIGLSKEKKYSHSKYNDLFNFDYNIQKVEIPEFYFLESYDETFSKCSFFDGEYFNKPVIIRSNAKGEDGENFTGAGIYDSLVINKREWNGKEWFYKISKEYIIEKIEELKEKNKKKDWYEKKQGVENDVSYFIQEYIPLMDKEYVKRRKFCFHDGLDGKFNTYGTINSCLIGNSDVASIEYNGGVFYVNSEGIEHFIDTTKVSIYMLNYIIELISYFKKEFGRPFQIEFGYDHDIFYIFQLRFLPEQWNIINGNEYDLNKYDGLNNELLFEGKCIGCVDGEFEIISNQENNNEKRGVIVLNNLYGASMWFDYECLPREGGLIIKGDSSPLHSHIHTICGELGLFCMYDEEKISSCFGNNDKEYLDFKGCKNIKVISNGKYGKVFRV